MLLGFMAIGLYAAMAVWIVQRSSWSRKRRVSLAMLASTLFVILAFMIYVLERSNTPTLGSGSGENRHIPLAVTALFVAMLTGMTARYFTKAIEERREVIRKLR